MKNLIRSYLLLIPLVASVAAAAGKQLPNILFIAVDDLKPMLGCYGDPEILTPHIDRLAGSGTVFLNNACQQAVCAPSRVSLMTGTYPDTTRVFDLKTQMREANPVTLTLPEYLRRFGYETTGVGKIYDPRSVDKAFDAPSWSQPFLQHGDQRYFSSEYGKPDSDRHSHFRSAEVKADNDRLRQAMKEQGIQRSDRIAYNELLREFPKVKPLTESMDVPDDAYKDGSFANIALDQMERLADGEKPFFLAVGFQKPHLPFVAPKKYWDLYDRSAIKPAAFQEMPAGAPAFAFQDSWELRGGYTGVPDGPLPEELQVELIHGYRACVSYIDAQVGKLLDKLAELNLREETIVVFWGDHGWHLGDHGMFCKHTNYEQAVRSPLIIACPGQKHKGAKTTSPTEFVDIFPTLCERAGIPIPESVEGRSLSTVLDNPEVMVREAALGQYPRNPSRMGYTLRDKRYRYVKWIGMDYQGGQRSGPVLATELYDYQEDPLETVNRAADPSHADVVARFERLLKERGIAP
jgi:iduronate 2-sulfatase